MRKINFALCLLAFLFLLSACSTVSHKDGPPNYHVDASRIPDAVPKEEHLSKYGNYRRYVVWGKVYHTLPTSQGYEEQGTASWYGTKFHKHHTSSGERYDLLAMTAAHKTLPLPTYVQVTNLKNGKQVIVKVNDRGPFSGNRLIDLSYAAALKLGMVGHGTAYVDVKAIDPIEYARRGTKYEPINLYASNTRHSSRKARTHNAPVQDIAENHNRTMYVQVGAFKNYAYAQKLRNRLQGITNSPINIASYKHAHHHLYHVRIGPFYDTASANRISQKLKNFGYPSKLS